MKHDYNHLHLEWAIREIPEHELTSQEHHILLVLLTCANKDNLSWRSHDTLSKITRYSRTTIKKYLKSLAQKKYIIVRPPAIYYRGSSNEYSLNVDHIMIFYPEENYRKGSPRDTLNAKKGSPRDDKGSPHDPRRGRHATTKKEREELKEEGSQTAPLGAADDPYLNPTPEDLKIMEEALEKIHKRFPSFKADFFADKRTTH